MPYIIAVVLLVVASVGFTLFQTSNNPVTNSFSEPVAIEQTDTTSSTPEETPIVPDVTVPSSIPTETPASPSNTLPKPKPTPTPAPAPTPAPKPTPTPAPINTTAYKNGTYRTSSSYRTPDGQYLMEVGVTVSNDIITSTSLSFTKGGGDSYSKKFNNSYQSTVIGRDLSTVHPSRIGGASLTTRAFNSALDTIRSQAAT